MIKRLVFQLPLVAAIVALAACGGPSAALADGDPASDVLVTTPLFLPKDASTFGQAQLVGLLDAAARAGFPIRVALIPSEADLGSVTLLWRRPGLYAKYLGMELPLNYHGQVLVVMPDGFGLSGGNPSPAEQSARAALAAPGVAAGSATTAVRAVVALARAAGHPIAAPALRAARAGAGSSDSAVDWLVFGAGALLIALAWGASVAVQPLFQPPRA